MSDRGAWINRFTNLWLACEKDPDLVHSLEPIEEKIGSLIRQELNAGLSKENIQDQEKWLEKFAGLWLASKKVIERDLGDKDSFPKRLDIKESLTDDNSDIEKLQLSRSSKNYSIDVQAEIEKGKVIIGDSNLGTKKISSLCENESSDLEDFDLKPEDLIVFDIDPEMAIRLLTSSKGRGL